jgi:hypothetical protein
MTTTGKDPTQSVAAEAETRAPISGWIETNPVKSSKSATQKQQEKQRSPLPLDWTRVKRRRTNNNNNNKNKNTENEDDCCALVSMLSEDSLSPNEELVQGLAVLCLHEQDPTWFQGYFFPSTMRNKPWGLLAVQQEIDDCMKSADGGYRSVSVTVFPFSQQGRTKVVYSPVDWTGGDMIQLRAKTLEFEPTKLVTGKQAVPHVERLFQAILQKCRDKLAQEEGETATASALELIPDVAVVSGPMKLVVPKPKQLDDLMDD